MNLVGHRFSALHRGVVAGGGGRIRQGNRVGYQLGVGGRGEGLDLIAVVAR